MLLLRDAHDAEARKRIIFSAADILTFTPTHSALRTSLNFNVRPHAYNARLHLNILDLVFVLSNRWKQNQEKMEREERSREMKQEEREEELERRYTRHSRENMSRGKNNDSGGRFDREED